ncbi:hypothetical protein OGATHE_003316 [Ogataea polymorpha]|uniref:Uncharacterized protein n=1 Tax=Ogataea polymorpha TaxID=460523 RepID=A0A9P8T3A3_9ASCO|nr:hypothetical protein OGATHE_003316 [Ogataea polymorpha]
MRLNKPGADFRMDIEISSSKSPLYVGIIEECQQAQNCRLFSGPIWIHDWFQRRNRIDDNLRVIKVFRSGNGASQKRLNEPGGLFDEPFNVEMRL